MSRVAAIWPLFVPAALVASITALASLSSASLQRTVTTMLIDLVLVVGLYVFAGNSGILSFGHMSFMAVGAYVTAFLTIAPIQKHFLLPGLPGFVADTEFGPIPAALVAGGAATLLALILSWPLMRLIGIASSLAMFAVLLIVYVTASNWDAVTRGQGALLGVPTNTTMWTALTWAIIAMAAAFLLQQSPIGLRLRATREDEIAARAAGIGVVFERSVAFCLSAFIVGIGGFEFAQFIGSFNPDAFYLGITFLTIAMLVIGGIGSLAGAVVGTVVVSALLEGLRQLENGVDVASLRVTAPAGLREVGVGALMLLILIFRPAGLTGGEEFRWPFRRSASLGQPLVPAAESSEGSPTNAA
jgi:branched-chain amino acid transport system permease protein